MAKILVAGQDLATLATIEAAIEGEGHDVVAALNGLEAYEKALLEQPDLVMLETAMPVFNGFETCRMLREDPEVPKTLPIVLITAEQIDPRKFEHSLATDQLLKVHSSLQLRDMLVKLLGEKAAVSR